MKGTLTNISPREIVRYTRNIRSEYEANFIKRIGARTKVDLSVLRNVFEAMYGYDWILQPYSKLYSAAKSTTLKSKLSEEEFLKRFKASRIGNIKRGYNCRYCVGLYRETVFYKKASKIYGKSNVDRYLSDIWMHHNDAMWADENCMRKCRDMISVEKLAKQYAPELYKDFIQQSKKDMRLAFKVVNMNDCKLKSYDPHKLAILGDELLSDIKHDFFVIALQPTKNSELLSKIIDRICTHARNMSYYGSGTYYYTRHMRQLTKAITDYYQMRNVMKMLSEMGIENKEGVWGKADDLYYRANNLNNKSRRVIEKVYKAKGDNEVKRMTLANALLSIAENEYRSRIYSPVLMSY